MLVLTYCSQRRKRWDSAKPLLLLVDFKGLKLSHLFYLFQSKLFYSWVVENVDGFTTDFSVENALSKMEPIKIGSWFETLSFLFGNCY